MIAFSFVTEHLMCVVECQLGGLRVTPKGNASRVFSKKAPPLTVLGDRFGLKGIYTKAGGVGSPPPT